MVAGAGPQIVGASTEPNCEELFGHFFVGVSMDGTPGVLVSWANMKTNQKTNKKTKDESSTPADLNNPTIHPSSIVPLTKEDQSNHPSAHLAKPATRNLQPATLVAEPSTLADGLPRDPLINPTIHESNNPPAHPAEPATCNLQPATLAVSPITDNCSLITSHPSPLPPTILHQPTKPAAAAASPACLSTPATWSIACSATAFPTRTSSPPSTTSGSPSWIATYLPGPQVVTRIGSSNRTSSSKTVWIRITSLITSAATTPPNFPKSASRLPPPG